MKKEYIYRGSIYVLGLIILAIGLSLNTQVMLGVSPILSTALTVNNLTELNFGNATFLMYALYVLVEIIIHIYLKDKKAIPLDLAQIPFSLIFTRFLNLFKAIIPDFQVDLAGSVWGSIPSRFVFLALAFLFTGIGACMSINMRLIPNAGDGIVLAIADLMGKPVGFGKNFFDITCVIFSVVVGMTFAGKIYGIGLGTLCAMIVVGRVMAVFNHFFKDKMLAVAGVTR